MPMTIRRSRRRAWRPQGPILRLLRVSRTHGKLRQAQRRVARRKKGSERRRKAVAVLQKIHEHVANQRRDFQHKEALKLVQRYGVIAVEDLNVKGLAGGMLAKSVQDAGWGGFLQMLAYKAESAGRKLCAVDPRGTSQTCVCEQEFRSGCRTESMSAPRADGWPHVIMSRLK